MKKINKTPSCCSQSPCQNPHTVFPEHFICNDPRQSPANIHTADYLLPALRQSHKKKPRENTPSDGCELYAALPLPLMCRCDMGAAAAAAAKEQRENPSCEPASVSHRVTDGRFFPRSQASGRRGPRCPPTPSCSPTPSIPAPPPPLSRSLAPALFPFDHIRAKTRGAIFREEWCFFICPRLFVALRRVQRAS